MRQSSSSSLGGGGGGSWMMHNLTVLLFICICPLFCSSLLAPNTSILFPNPPESSSSSYYYSTRNRAASSSYSGEGSGGRRNGVGGGGGPPLSILRTLGAGGDWAGILKDFGGNVGVERNVTTGEQYLVGRGGGPYNNKNNSSTPILDSTGRRVVVGGDGGVSRTRFTQVGLPGASTTNGGATTSTTTRKDPLAGRAGNRPAGVGMMNVTLPVMTSISSSSSSSGGSGSQWSVAACRPEEQTVALQGDVAHYEPHIIHHPRCVRVERCGGCCGTDILACEPIETTEVEVPIQKFVWVSELGKMNWMGQEWVKVQRHTKCQCQCRTKAQDCRGLQVYEESACLCVCGNREEQERCGVDGGDKVWDPTHCLCTCREIRDCSSGFYFNLSSCQCLPLGSKKRGRRNPALSSH